MGLELSEEIRQDGNLLGECMWTEQFSYFNAVLARDLVALRDSSYDMPNADRPNNCIVLSGQDIPVVEAGIAAWDELSRSLWGVRDNAWLNEPSCFFSPEVSREYADNLCIIFSKGKLTNLPNALETSLPEGARTHEVISNRGIDVIIGNMHFGLVKDDMMFLTSYRNVPHIGGSFGLYWQRSHRYEAARSLDDVLRPLRYATRDDGGPYRDKGRFFRDLVAEHKKSR